MSSTFADFFVKTPSDDGSFTFLAGLTVKGYNVSISSDLGTIGTSAGDGKIAGGSITATAGDLIRFRVESNSHGQCGFCQTIAGSTFSQDLVLKPSAGINAVARPQARRAYRAVPTVDAAYAEVFYLLSGDPIKSAVSLGKFPIGQEVHLNVNPPTDRTYVLIPMPYNRWGVPTYRNLSDAYAAVNGVSMNRTPPAPTTAQFGAATETRITLSISAYSRFTVARRLRYADDSGMTTNVVNGNPHDLTSIEKIGYEYVTRAHVGGQNAKTIYAQISDSSTGVDGPWGAWSTALQVAWAADVAGGGTGSPTTGGGDPSPPDDKNESPLGN